MSVTGGAGLRRRAARSRGCGRAGSAPRTAPAGCRARCVIAIRALVLAGLPVTPMRTSSAATSLRALPWAVKIAPLAASRSPRSMPGPRGRAPTSRARLTPSKIFSASAPISTPASVGNAQSSSSMTTPSSAFRAGLDLEQPQLDRAVRAEQRAAREAEQQAVADLAGGAGDGDLERELSSRELSSTVRRDATATGRSSTLAAERRSASAGLACCMP